MSSCGHWYFAYGSNMNPARMAERGVDFVAATGGFLANCRMQFDKRGKDPREGHANLVFAAGEKAEGVLYELRDEHQIAKLDPFERTPINYSRELQVIAAASGRSTVAWTYFANPGARAPGLRPSQAYLNHLLAGREHLSSGYWSRLAETPVLEATP
ncbi:MAG: gamma-glutamylcyclotransferase family protein [Pseudomonadota bacterium]